MIRLKILLAQWLAAMTRKLKNNFYLYLALLFTLVILIDAAVFQVGLNMRDKAFDFMVKHRIIQPAPDSEIVIVDINEASLAAMAKEYGRWPWPRQILAEFVENIQNQQPKAIVFDILFSDADVYNPDSDAYFNEVMAACENCFFPMLRLDPTQDKLSQLKYVQIPGAEKTSPEVDENKKIAAVLPYFPGALKAHRLGTHNVYPDLDGILREYRLYHEDSGWLLPSLPLEVGLFASASARKSTLPQDMLINWRGKPFSYHYVTFSDVFEDMAKKEKTRPQNEFTNKIVIIGATASGLFDIKPTAMDKQFPGVEILATAIDNVIHNDYLKVWRGTLPYISLSLLLLWLTAFAFYFKIDRDRFNAVFTGGQAVLLILSYLAINFTQTYLDLTAPILIAVGYFGIAKTYALATDRALQQWLAFGVNSQDGNKVALMMPIIFESDLALGDTVMKKIKRQIELLSKTPNSIEILHGVQTGIWGLFGNMVVISWLYADNQKEYAENAYRDAHTIAISLHDIILSLGLPNSTHVRYSQHELSFDSSTLTHQGTANMWRLLFAQAMIKLEQEKPMNKEQTT